MPRYHKVEINKTEWIVPERYQMLTPVGSGAYGQVWYVFMSLIGNMPIFMCNVSAVCIYINYSIVQNLCTATECELNRYIALTWAGSNLCLFLK